MKLLLLNNIRRILEMAFSKSFDRFHRRTRRAYSDIENSVGDFLDNLDFYLEKVAIFRNIVLDVRQLYKVLKNDVLMVRNRYKIIALKFYWAFRFKTRFKIWAKLLRVTSQRLSMTSSVSSTT